MKKQNKFLASAVTTALVASAVSPVMAASDFTDVPKQYADAVDYLVQNNVTQGIGNKKFGTDKSITRLDAAVMLAKMLNLDTKNAPASGFTDVPKNRSAEVNALKAAGIIGGKSATRFGAQDPIKRGEMALILQKAYDLKGSPELKFTDVNKRYAEAVQAMVANNITNGVSTTKFGTDQNVKRGDFAIFLFRSDAPTAVAPKIEKVNFNSSVEAEVTFNQAMTKQSLETYKNYSFDGQHPVAIFGAADGKSVVLQFASSIEMSEKVVIVEPMTAVAKDSAGKVQQTERYRHVVSYSDKEAPKVVEAAYEDGQIIVTFNEKLGTAPNAVYVKNKAVTATINPKDHKQVLIPVVLTSGEVVDLSVDGAKDVVGNLMNGAYKGKVTAPVIQKVQPNFNEVEVVGQDKVKVTLNTPLMSDTFEAHLQEVNTVNNTKLSFKRIGTTNVYEAFIDQKYFGTRDEMKAQIIVEPKVMTSTTDLKNERIVKAVTIKKDTVAPKVIDKTVSEDRKTVTLHFDERIKVDKTQEALLQFVDHNHISQLVTGIKVGEDEESLIFSFETPLIPKPYKITLVEGYVSDLYGNAMVRSEEKFEVALKPGETLPPGIEKPEEKEAPKVVNIYSGTVANTNSLEYIITYSTSMSTDAANLSTYELNDEKLPQSALIAFQDAQQTKVSIKFPEGSFNIGDADNGSPTMLDVMNLKSQQGKLLVENRIPTIIRDNTSAKITKAELAPNHSTLTLTFDEDLLLLQKTVKENGQDVKKDVEVSDIFTIKNAEATSMSVSGNQVTIQLNRVLDRDNLIVEVTNEGKYLRDDNKFGVQPQTFKVQ
ncbi:S-layer homology domain-containing protein [Savagea sp. SN6]|uniref:S-layer homology domain-containing protein n=1 Tax=Savagea serpentis TaxID=2785297 RepID=A0A8J7GAT8_9BACL|nr:S-layer homology domain-containing protein [Savagea serpentis]MBF4501389.1 S-layer homology domain-containing protein [Savagea serpentis]